jgi:hypothetical protein
MTEVRTTSATGGEKGVKPEAWALLPSEALEEIARVYAFGAEKYAAHNWRKGYEWSKSFSAMCRHIFAWWRGEDLDPESGLSHLGPAGFHVLGLLTFSLDRSRYKGYDDRYTVATPEVGAMQSEAKLARGGYYSPGTYAEGSFGTYNEAASR